MESESAREGTDDEEATEERGPERVIRLTTESSHRRPTEIVHVPPRRNVPQGTRRPRTWIGQVLVERTIIDLVFTRNGCRKTITRYIGKKSYCPKCGQAYLPPAIARIGHQMFGHGFQAWTVYQRVFLRLPYRIIAQVTEHLFGVGSECIHGNQLPRLPGRLLCPDRGGHPPGDPEERLRPRR